MCFVSIKFRAFFFCSRIILAPTQFLENLISNEINIGELKDGLLDPQIDIADYFD